MVARTFLASSPCTSDLNIFLMRSRLRSFRVRGPCLPVPPAPALLPPLAGTIAPVLASVSALRSVPQSDRSNACNTVRRHVHAVADAQKTKANTRYTIKRAAPTKPQRKCTYGEPMSARVRARLRLLLPDHKPHLSPTPRNHYLKPTYYRTTIEGPQPCVGSGNTVRARCQHRCRQQKLP